MFLRQLGKCNGIIQIKDEICQCSWDTGISITGHFFYLFKKSKKDNEKLVLVAKTRSSGAKCTGCLGSIQSEMNSQFVVDERWRAICASSVRTILTQSTETVNRTDGTLLEDGTRGPSATSTCLIGGRLEDLPQLVCVATNGIRQMAFGSRSQRNAV